MQPGLYDNLRLNRRELWVQWDTFLIFHGWCHREALRNVDAGSFWKPKEPFGTFPQPTK